jgi:glycosyltransferase involved in cell wall biosynthesis
MAERFPALHLVMAGPGAPARRGDRITWTGLLDTPELRFGAFHAADVFILPSHSENFGFAVVEALARGLPVLISTRVNIWKEIVDDDAGFAELDDQAGTIRLLEHWLGLDEETRSQMRRNAVECFEKRFEVSQVTADLMGLITTSIRNRESLQSAAWHIPEIPR